MSEESSLDKIGLIDRVALRDRIYNKIHEMLLCGEIPPGETMSIRFLADRLGTSAMPVREALRQLLAENGIEMLPNRTIRVPLMPADRLTEIKRIRLYLEGMVAEAAAANISKSALKVAKQNNENWKKHTLGKDLDIRKSLYYNKQLHFSVYEAVDMPIALGIIRSLWLQMGPFFGMIMREMHRRKKPEQSIDRTAEHHDKLIAALEGRDGKAAREAIEQDISKATEVFLSQNWIGSERGS